MPELSQPFPKTELLKLGELARIEKRAVATRAFVHVQPWMVRNRKPGQRCGLAFWAADVGVQVVTMPNSRVAVVQPLERPRLVPLEQVEPQAVTTRATLQFQTVNFHALKARLTFRTLQVTVAVQDGYGCIEGLEL